MFTSSPSAPDEATKVIKRQRGSLLDAAGHPHAVWTVEPEAQWRPIIAIYESGALSAACS